MGRSSGPDQTVLGVSRITNVTRVLGPGLRAAVWVRGCPLRCVDCITAEDLPFEGGERWPVSALASRLTELPAEITGVTFSGGEPMAQAAALAALVDLLRAQRDWSVLAYSGFTLKYLREHGSVGQRDLLDRLDILVDGPYIAARHADLLWRASANQQIHYLTGRHTPTISDRSAGIEVSVSADTVTWTGVPAVPGFRKAFEAAMATEGIYLATERSDNVP